MFTKLKNLISGGETNDLDILESTKVEGTSNEKIDQEVVKKSEAKKGADSESKTCPCGNEDCGCNH